MYTHTQQDAPLANVPSTATAQNTSLQAQLLAPVAGRHTQAVVVLVPFSATLSSTALALPRAGSARHVWQAAPLLGALQPSQ